MAGWLLQLHEYESPCVSIYPQRLTRASAAKETAAGLNIDNIDLMSDHGYPRNIALLQAETGLVRGANKGFVVGEWDWTNDHGGDSLADYLQVRSMEHHGVFPDTDTILSTLRPQTSRARWYGASLATTLSAVASSPMYVLRATWTSTDADMTYRMTATLSTTLCVSTFSLTSVGVADRSRMQNGNSREQQLLVQRIVLHFYRMSGRQLLSRRPPSVACPQIPF